MTACALPLLLLGACATPPAGVGDLGPGTGGRLSLRVDATPARPVQSLTAAFELRGSGERGELKLLTPLGTQIASARWRPGRADLSTPDGEWSFADLESLAERALGERVPLAALPDWIAGRPWAAVAHALSPAGFEQMGWRVDISGQAQGRIVASRAAPPAVTLRVQLDRPEP